MKSKNLCYFAATTFAAMLVVAGCPTDGGTGDDDGGTSGTKAITGTWVGSLNCTDTQSLGTTTLTPTTSTLDQTIEFDANGQPVAITILGFVSDANSSVTLKLQGETATANVVNGTTNATYVVTVRSATYSSTSAKLTLDITYTATNGASSYAGTGLQTIDVAVNGSSMTYTADVSYQVTLSVMSSGIRLESGDAKHCTGTLAKQ